MLATTEKSRIEKILTSQEQAIESGSNVMHGTVTDRVERMYEAIRAYRSAAGYPGSRSSVHRIVQRNREPAAGVALGQGTQTFC